MTSARRCALCYGFDGDLSRKKGQIAHIDHDPTNADEGNLVYLCLEHHDEYDSKTSQVKGISEAELRTYKTRLLNAIAAGEHWHSPSQQSAAAAKTDAIRGHDERLFREANDLMSEGNLLQLLDQLQSDDSYFMSQAHRLDKFRSFFSETGNQFIDPDASGKLQALLESLDSLLLFVARHFFVFPDSQNYTEDLRLCMYPELNVDRHGDGTKESMQRYCNFQVQLDKTAETVRNAYKEYRLVVKHYLYL
jgi:hypothetical protein